MCKVCRAGGRKAADEFCFEDIKLECVCEFAYLGDMLNDAGGVEQTVAARVRATWMKFRKQWIDVVEEDIRKSGVVQQDAGDREDWRRRAVKGLANPR